MKGVTKVMEEVSDGIDCVIYIFYLVQDCSGFLLPY